MKKFIYSILVFISGNYISAQVLISSDPSIETQKSPTALELTPKPEGDAFKIETFKSVEPLVGDQPLKIDPDTKKIEILNATGQRYLSKYFTSTTSVDSYNDMATDAKGLNTSYMPFGGGSNSTYSATYGGCVQMNSILIPNDASCQEQQNGSSYDTPGYQKAKLGITDDIISININFPQKLFAFIFINGSIYPKIETLSSTQPAAAIYNYLSGIGYPNGDTKEYWLSGSVNGTWTGYSGTIYDNQGSYNNGYVEDHGPTVLSEIIYSYDGGITWYHGGIMQNTEFTKGAPINITLAGAVDIPASVFPDYPQTITEKNILLKVIHHARTRGHSGQTGRVYGGPLNGSTLLNDAYTFRVNSVNTLVEYKYTY